MAKASGTIDLKSMKEAAKTATNYIDFDATNGLRISQSGDYTKPYVQIINNGINIIRDSTHKVVIDSDSMDIYVGDATNSIAAFGDPTRIGKQDEARIEISANNISGYGSQGNNYFEFANSTKTLTSTLTSNAFYGGYISAIPYNSANALSYTVPTSFEGLTIRFKISIINPSTLQTSFATVEFSGAGTKSIPISFEGHNYTFTITYDGHITFNNFYLTSGQATETYRVKSWFSVTQTTIAPSYIIGGGDITADGGFAYAEGYDTTASGDYSHAEGYQTVASGNRSHAEGNSTTANSTNSHAEGWHTVSSGGASHAEGYYTTASSANAHAEGQNTTASGSASHAEGHNTTASGPSSHAEGRDTIADGSQAHAEGRNSQALGSYSHAQNYGTVATETYQTVIGKYNQVDRTGSGTTEDPYVYTNAGDYAFIVGNGTDDTPNKRSNALTVDWNGNITMKSHSSPMGNLQSASANVAITTANINTYSIGPSLTLTPGTYIVRGVAQFNSTSSPTSPRITDIDLATDNSTSSTASPLSRVRVCHGTGYWARLEAIAPVVVTENTTVYVKISASVTSTAQGCVINALRIV